MALLTSSSLFHCKCCDATKNHLVCQMAQPLHSVGDFLSSGNVFNTTLRTSFYSGTSRCGAARCCLATAEVHSVARCFAELLGCSSLGNGEPDSALCTYLTAGLCLPACEPVTQRAYGGHRRLVDKSFVHIAGTRPPEPHGKRPAPTFNCSLKF